MSEFQFVHFLAIDRPLDDDQLEFMRRQSTRAEVTRWGFKNECHYGDFHGDALEMIRHGYDAHLHYANFGIRKLMLRLPAGLPCDQRTFEAFVPEDGVTWYADKKGKGGVLEFQPEADAGSYDEEFYGLESQLPEISPIRDLLIAGDLRPLYIAWLAFTGDEEVTEPPVPAGLDQLTPALNMMAEFYEVDQDLIAAAGQGAPALPDSTDADQTLKQWTAKQSSKQLQEPVSRLLGKNASAVRAETLSIIRDAAPTEAWPTAEPSRTLAQLRESAGELGRQRSAREQQVRDATRRKKLDDIAVSPNEVITKVKNLVKLGSTKDYEKAADELADLREALGPEKGPKRARTVAEKLRRDNPTLNRLTSALRKRGLSD